MDGNYREILDDLEVLIQQSENLTSGLRIMKERLQRLRYMESKEENKKSNVIDSRIRAAEWSDIPQGKRFLTAKELGRYLGLSPATIHNQVSTGTLPIRHTKIGKALRFDMKEILEYLDTLTPFWERDKQKASK